MLQEVTVDKDGDEDEDVHDGVAEEGKEVADGMNVRSVAVFEQPEQDGEVIHIGLTK